MMQKILNNKTDGGNTFRVKGEMFMQRKQMMQYAVVTQNGIVEKVGKSTIYQPKTNFKGGQINWYKDKLKQKHN